MNRAATLRGSKSVRSANHLFSSCEAGMPGLKSQNMPYGENCYGRIGQTAQEE